MKYYLVELCALSIALAGVPGCDKNDQQGAQDAQREAEAKARAAQQEANEKIADAKADAEKAAAKASTARAEVKASLQQELTAVDRKITSLKERGAATKGAAQKNYEAAYAEVQTRRSTVEADLRKLESETGSGFDAARTSAETDIAALKASVDTLENTTTAKAAK
jgi:hypothetical protein